ncbi:MAG: hypothetical protein SOW34_10895 [Oliverpabstia sp.]|nr:hypothetical protein [Oliverpabstia sp.]
MCDVKKYSDIFREIKKLNPDDTLQLVLESQTEEEKSFYEMVGDFLLQNKQRETIARNVF